MSFTWRPDLATGNTIIDNQHKGLFTAASDLFSACQIGKEQGEVEKTMAFLAQYVVTHFTDEEALQVEYNYPDYPQHKLAHATFTEQVKKLYVKLSQEGPTDDFISEVYISIGEWLLNHIRVDDFKMANYIQSKECSGKTQLG